MRNEALSMERGRATTGRRGGALWWGSVLRGTRCGAGLAGSLVWVLGACVQPAAVGRYARAARKTAAELPALAADMHASCLRLEGFRASRNGDGWFDRADLEPRCAERQTVVRRTVTVERVLASYFAALAGLADNDVVDYDDSLDELAGSLVDDARLDQKQVRAVADLAELAASVATEGYRRAKLASVIENQNANVATVVDALAEIVGTDYASILSVEETGMNLFYRSALAEGAEHEPLAAILVRDTRDTRAAALHEKQTALAAYVKALATIKAGHQRLYDSRRHLDAKALVGALASYAEQLEEMIPALHEAF